MKMLLVDDSRTMRNVQKNHLKAIDANIQFVEAGDGAEALSTLAADPAGYDAFLVDWNMPNMDGLTFVRRIREKDKLTPIIMVTTEAEKGRVVEAIRAGVSNYVVKPFSAETLITKVRQTLAKRTPSA